MRLALSAIIIILGANLLVDLLDSNMMDVIEERNQSIEKLLNS